MFQEIFKKYRRLYIPTDFQLSRKKEAVCIRLMPQKFKKSAKITLQNHISLPSAVKFDNYPSLVCIKQITSVNITCMQTRHFAIYLTKSMADTRVLVDRPVNNYLENMIMKRAWHKPQQILYPHIPNQVVCRTSHY